jgi:Tol biopolymer transport system component
MNSDGSARQQLTFDGLRNVEPAVSPDGRYVAFVSYREDSKPHLWKIGADGTGLKQLTSGSYEDTPRFSSDSQWVIYHHLDPDGLSKISIDGGEPVAITKEPSAFPDISPDGKLIACLSQDDASSAWQATIIPFEGGPAIKTFALPPGFSLSVPGIQWAPDGLAVTYVLATNGAANIWSQPLSGGPPKQLTDFAEGQMFYFSWSIGGQLACVRGTSTKELFLVRDFH